MKTLNNDFTDILMHFYKSGAKPPINLGMGSFNEFYGLKMGTCTDITGYPYSGKTLFLKEILFNSYIKHNLVHCLYLPDDGTNEEVLANFFHKLTGKTFDKKYSNYPDENEFYRYTQELLNNFIFVDVNEKIEPIEFWNKACELGCNTASIDSWNTLAHKDNGTVYLEKVLSERNRIAQKNNVHFFTIIHPNKPTAINYDKNGNLKPASQHDLKGGAEWNNNGKNIISIHKYEREGNNYHIEVLKTKPRIVGKTGELDLKFHIPSQRFYEVMPDGIENFFYDNGYHYKTKSINELVNPFENGEEAPF